MQLLAPLDQAATDAQVANAAASAPPALTEGVHRGPGTFLIANVLQAAQTAQQTRRAAAEAQRSLEARNAWD